ncbi:MAG TPA: hypothetical protein VK524_28060, partial [Polyangiaceae bacterium]|nr:hypothetical protein [Polyangiaceae bacterium]
HSDRTREIRSALDTMQPKRALALVNEELEVDRAEEVPEEVSGDNALLILDRAMILQQLDSTKLSSRDLELADKQIEILDLSRNAVDDLGKYLFSDESGPYKAPAYEKLMINSMNMLNYLVRRDLNGARIEARRLSVMQKFIYEHEDPALAMVAPGSYLAGFTFEKSGRPQEALRYYDEALKFGEYRTLVEPIQRLAGLASYRSPRIRKLLGDADPLRSAAPTAPAESPDGDLLVVVNFGRVPAKVAKRIPIGLALTYASGIISPTDRGRANALAAQGLVTWVNYPELGRARGQYAQPEFALGSRWMPLEGMLAVDAEAKRAWEDARGAVVASAITRMIARIVAGEAARQATGGGLTGLLVSLGTQATLTAVDTPDTRSWATLPARIAFGRMRVPAGTHWVTLGARGVRRQQRLVMSPGGWAVLHLTVLS